MRGKQIVEMHAKDIRNSEELKSQKKKQSQFQKSMDQTLNAKMRDDNNETVKHEKSMCSRCRSAACEDGQGGDPEVTTTIRKSVIINEYESHKASQNDTILTITSLESAGREECDEFSARDGYQQDNVHQEVMRDIEQLQDGIDIMSGTDVFPNPE